MWTVRRILAATEELFARAGVDEARLDAELLLAHALGVRRIDLFVDRDRPLGEAELARHRALIRERANARTPVAYLTGRREFYSIEMEVTRDVLVPRPETELVVDAVLEEVGRRAGATSTSTSTSTILVADVGTGSGAIAVAVAKLAKAEVRVIATDASERACAVARRNAERHGVAGRVEVRAGHLLEPLADAAGRIGILASNPPYVAEPERASLAPEVLAEPPGALFSGPDGLDAIREIVRHAPRVLAPGGLLLVEHGAGQGEAARALAREAGLVEVATRRDLPAPPAWPAGRERLLAARRAPL